jgi:copper chaperone CopZ
MGCCINRKKIDFITKFNTMKCIKILFAILLFTGFTNTANAQFKDWLNKKKEEAKQKVNDKIDQKSSEGIDKAVDAPEKVIDKKVKKGKKQTEPEETQATDNVSNEVQPINEIIITTNIKCNEGKKIIEQLINDTPGVSSISIDVKTGKTYLTFSGEATNKEEIENLIRQNGYEANGKKKTNGTNACK